MANEAFARVKIDQLLKDADWALADGYGVRFRHPSDSDGNVGDVLYGCRGGALTAPEAKRKSVRLSVEETQRNITRLAVG